MAIFEPNRCHHRDANGKPDCRKQKASKSVNLCKVHEAQYRAGEYRARRDTAYGSQVALMAKDRRPTTATAEPDTPKRRGRPPKATNGATQDAAKPARRGHATG